MHEPLANRVRAFLSAHGLLRPDALIVVAVSGGPDSLCLLHVLAGLRHAGGPQLHVAHLDHGFRGDQSAAEARAVADTAAAWGLACTLAAADVPGQARARRQNPQAAARQARYAFLAACARAQGALAVAVAHSADDQAETVLLHALRGAGPAGLRGMRPAVPWAEWEGGGTGSTQEHHPHPPIAPSPLLIRPLLGAPRAEIAAYCAAHGLRPSDDPSNRAERYARSRVRHRLLPALAAHNPQIVAALGRTAQICADDVDFIQGQLDAAWPALAAAGPGQVALDLAGYRALHPAMQRYALRRAAAQLAGPESLSYAQVEAARATIAAGRPAQLQLGRALQLDLGYNSVALRLPVPGPAPSAPQLAGESLALAAPGRTALGAGWACLVQPEPPATPSPWWLAVPADLAGALRLRRRRPGDRFRPAGGPGSRTIQNFFVDRKIPRSLREAWPLLVAGEAILWVAGLRADQGARADAGGMGALWVGIIREPEQEGSRGE